ncbi:hypothetical protein PsYK624_058530 [Phanerochaete sordida]|uniref:Uncharacterized protein n=1 Tax=Phanerochaete sordida TaxID=48140 RepID=A0A9P3G7Z8_9APHY|nr:hypothetical protein PsYK624_058530 [Phanerochaete sordida]
MLVYIGISFVAVVLTTNWTGNVGFHMLTTPTGAARRTRGHAQPPIARGAEQAVSRLFGLLINLLGSAKLVQLFGNATNELLWLTLFNLQGALKASIQDASRIDFNLALTSFETHIASTLRFIDPVAESGACLVCVLSVSETSCAGPSPRSPHHTTTRPIAGMRNIRFVC